MSRLQAVHLPKTAGPAGASADPWESALPRNHRGAGAWYWTGLPWRWGRQWVRNSHDILRVLDLTRVRPLGAGLVGLDHPWVTGVEPRGGGLIWDQNVLYRTPRAARLADGPSDATILRATGRFLARRVRLSAITPEIPWGPVRRMPHAINYMHGSSHYNSGIILLNDLEEGYRHFTDPRFRRELQRFVAREQREVLILFRDREYALRDYAYLSCCLRLTYSWFCNPNGPRGNVLWGNFGPFAAANLITGCWARDVYALTRPGGAQRVVRPGIRGGEYFQEFAEPIGRATSVWPERALAWLNDQRIRWRGARAGLRFVDRRQVYADQIARRVRRGQPDRPLPDWLDTK